MDFNFIEHKNISDKNLYEISQLKIQHWDYPIVEHINWMKKNLKPNDIHLILKENGIIIGYLSLVNITAKLDTEDGVFLGIGNVCVSNHLKGMQLGFLLMKLSEYYLQKHKIKGILLCKEPVLSFYKKCGWILYEGRKFVENTEFLNFILTNDEITCQNLVIPKSF